MHLSSMDKMQSFLDTYLKEKSGQPLRILDLGSTDIGGSYRDLFRSEQWEYLGLDLCPGDNVDVALSDPYTWKEVDSSSVDVFVSGQTFEHIEYFWQTMLEIARILKPGGLCCIVAPSGGPEHRYPVDCWRFYPDGFRALARYAGLETLEAYTDWDPAAFADDSASWKDTVLVARKPATEKKTRAGQVHHVYQASVRPGDDSALARLIPHVPPGSVVLELGPATGYFTRYLTQELGCTVDCVEISEDMAAQTREFCRSMVLEDLDRIDFSKHFQAGSYDVVIVADVLEHLRSPEKVLLDVRELLKPSGRCLLSVPNIAHAAVIGNLLRGRFEYTEEGLLDATHLHFFTRESISTLAVACGFEIETVHTVIRSPDETELGDTLVGLPGVVEDFLVKRPEALVYQYILVLGTDRDRSAPPPRQGQAPDPVELRRLFLQGLFERNKELEQALSQAREYVRLREQEYRLQQERAQNVLQDFEAYKQQFEAYKTDMTRLLDEKDRAIESLHQGLSRAQTLAFERLDELQTIKKGAAYKLGSLFKKK